MVAAFHNGASLRRIARRFHVSVGTVHYWVQRASNCSLTELDWTDRSRAPYRTTRIERAIEDLVLTIRRDLKESSVLGEYGAPAIYSELVSRRISPLPSVRTVGRILERRGALDGRRKIRRPPPVPGWYLPEVAQRANELDSFDVIEDLFIEGGIHVDVFTAISLHGGLVGSWPDQNIPATKVVSALSERWRALGLPAYAQFDK